MSKVVYVVGSGGHNVYSAMTRVAVASVRLTNPETSILLACDSITAAALKSRHDPLIGEVNETIVCDAPSGTDAFRARFVKTQLRNLVDGPFLYLDSDTVVRKDLSELFSLDTDIACALNHSSDVFELQILEKDRDDLARIGWKTRNDFYVNGGVVFYGDTTGARHLADDWHNKWLVSCKLTRECRDQPALNAAIFNTQPILMVLPHRYNAQLMCSPRTVVEASIWHYYASAVDEPVSEFSVLVHKVLGGAELRVCDVRTMVQSHHPWRRRFWIDDLIADRMIRKGRFSDEYAMWFEGHRMRSILHQLRNIAMGRI
jgi:hypothetical protein